MVLYRPLIDDDRIPDGCKRCPSCGGTGAKPRPRESWEAPIYGDDIITYTKCFGLHFIEKEKQMSYSNDIQVLTNMKKIIEEFNTLLSTKFNEGTPVDKDGLSEAMSYVDIALDMELLKINEHNPD